MEINPGDYVLFIHQNKPYIVQVKACFVTITSNLLFNGKTLDKKFYVQLPENLKPITLKDIELFQDLYTEEELTVVRIWANSYWNKLLDNEIGI